MSCCVGCRHSSDPTLLWLWRRLVSIAPIRPLAWERYVPREQPSKGKKIKKKKKKKILPNPSSSADTVLLCPQALKSLLTRLGVTGIFIPVSQVWAQPQKFSAIQLGKAARGDHPQSFCSRPRALPTPQLPSWRG